MDSIKLTSQQLREAADLIEQIESLKDKLAKLTGSKTEPISEVPKKSKFSAAGLAKLRAAQKARWAKIKAEKAGKSAAQSDHKTVKPAKKSKMSAAARAKIAAAAKARWAKAKAAGKTAL